MTDRPLAGHEFETDSGERSPEEFIDLVHDPDILYYHIKDAYEKSEQELDVDAGDKAQEVKIHARVEVFQSAIQYVEAFSIYLLAYFKGRENLIEDLTSTFPSEVEEFYDALETGEIDEWLEEEGIDDDYEILLETVFGYLYLETVDSPDGDGISEDELEARIQESTDVIDDEIRAVGEFYTRFRDIYNAVKHGNRVIPQTNGAFEFTPFNGEDSPAEMEVDRDFVLFVCRGRGRGSYTVLLPINYLLEQTISITEKVHNLFNHLKSVSEAVIEEKEYDVSFFKYEEGDEGSQDAVSDWIIGHNEGGIFILPRTEEMEAFLSEPFEWEFVGRVELRDGELHIRTENNQEVSDKFPVQMKVRGKDVDGLSPRSLMNLQLSFTINDLDAVQYLDLLELQDYLADESLDGAIVHDEQSGRDFPVGVPKDFPLPELHEFLERDRMEQVALLQKITGRRIPVPLAVTEDQIEIIDDCIKRDLTREDAVEAVEKLDELGDSEEYTEVMVEKMTPEGEVLDSEYIESYPGTVSLSLTDEESGEDYEAEKLRVPVKMYDVSFEEVVDALRADLDFLDEILDRVPRDLEIDEQSEVCMLYRQNESGFWFEKEELRVQVLDESVSHPPIRCELCGQATMDVQSHLTDDCPTLTDGPLGDS